MIARMDIPVPEPIPTRRLLLRPVTDADVPVLVRLATDADVLRHLGGPRDTGRARARAAELVGAPGHVTVTLADGTPAGIVRLAPDPRTGEPAVTCALAPGHRGHGYGREAVDAVLRWGFGLAPAAAVPRIVAVVGEADGPSRRMLAALGMVQVDRFTESGAPQAMYALHRTVPELGRRLRQHVGTDTLLAVAAGVIVRDAAGRILLQHRDDGTWGIPGGGLEAGESLEQAAARELYEETGLVADSFTPLDTYSGPEFFLRYPDGNQMYVVGVTFLANGVTGEPRADGEEGVELRFCAPGDWPDGLNFYNRRLLDRCLPRL